MAGQRQTAIGCILNRIRWYCDECGTSTVGGCTMVLLLLMSLIAVGASFGSPKAGGTEGNATTTGAGSTPGGNGGNAPFALLGRLETAMWRMVNRDRTSPSVEQETKGRAKPLEWDERLAAVAREHSEEMAATGSFSHTGADGSAPMTRVTKAGIRWLATGENIAKIDLGSGFVPVSETTASEQVVSKAETLFMDEPRFQRNHRGNILNSSYDHVGIGIARAADGSFYITQEFAKLQ